MVSKSTSDSTSKTKVSDVTTSVRHKILRLEKQIQSDRVLSVKEKFQTNRQKLDSHVSLLVSADRSSSAERSGVGKMISSRIRNPLHIYSGTVQGFGEKDIPHCQDAINLSSSRLPLVEKIPSYTTWMFLDRNQRMAEDQSVVGRRRIYYDQNGSEALVCSDSEEEITEPDEEKHEFSQADDRIIWAIAEDHGLCEEVLNVLTQFIGGSSSEILDRYSLLKRSHEEKQTATASYEKTRPDKGIYLEKTLSANLDSLDNLFCRRCLVFDCRLHGCSQGLINSSEKMPYPSELENDGKPCGDHCYLKLQIAKDLPHCSFVNANDMTETESRDENCLDSISLSSGESGKRKSAGQTHEFPEGLTESSNDPQGYSKKQKMLLGPNEVATGAETNLAEGDKSSIKISDLEIIEINKDDLSASTRNAPELNGPPTEGVRTGSEWKPLEKELYLKGLEIFGRNSCLIAKNLLPGLRTCLEVSTYMNREVAAMSQGSNSRPDYYLEGNGNVDANNLVSLPCPFCPASLHLHTKKATW